jgi:hypothetical protein
MAESEIQVTSSGGTRVRTDTKSIGGQTRHQEFFLQGEHSLAAYGVHAAGLSIATLNDHLIQIMAGSSLVVRLRRIWIWQAALAGAANTVAFDLLRLTTAGTGGGTITPRPLDSADSASGATVMSLPTVKGTEGVQIIRGRLGIVAAQPTNPNGQPLVLWDSRPDSKPLIIPSGTSNGIAVKVVGNVATATVDVYAEFVETSFV